MCTLMLGKRTCIDMYDQCTYMYVLAASELRMCKTSNLDWEHVYTCVLPIRRGIKSR